MQITISLYKYRFLLIPVVLVFSALFFVGGPDYNSPRSFRAAWNLGHIIYFALLPLIIFTFTPGIHLKPIVQSLFTIGITLILGTVVELLQYGLNRIPDLNDIFKNIIGASIAIFFFLPIRKLIPIQLLYAIRSMIIALVVLQMYPMAIALIDEYQARRDFPTLSDFRTPFQINRWGGSADFTVENVLDDSNSILRVSFSTSEYSEVNLKYFPNNWSQYLWFQFRVYNPSPETLALNCRIHDKEHDKGIRRYNDRFNKAYPISQGWSTIDVSIRDILQAPENRQMDLHHIREVAFFTYRLPQNRVIYIDDLVLLK